MPPKCVDIEAYNTRTTASLRHAVADLIAFLDVQSIGTSEHNDATCKEFEWHNVKELQSEIENVRFRADVSCSFLRRDGLHWFR